MIATGLVFLLGALVATLLMLLFVPILWRNAQRLARRDYAATMPATMSEIRAEIDHVRAQAAVTIRRNEMTAQKARERAALERAAVGRLTHAHADVKLRGEQHRDEANVLRATLAQMQERIDGLEETRLGLEHENAALREEITGMEAATRALEDELRDEARRPATTDDRSPAADDARMSGDAEPPRVAAATAALLALAKAHRGAPAARAETAGASTEGAGPQLSFASEARVVEELSALAKAPRPSDPAERERQNGRVRERIAEVAARIIQMTGVDQRDARPEPAASSRAEPDLAEHVRRTVQPGAETASTEPEPEPVKVQAEQPLAPQRTGTKRRRRGPRSRPAG